MVTVTVTMLLPLGYTCLSQVPMGRKHLLYLLVNAGRKGEREQRQGMPIIQNMAGGSFNSWKMPNAKTLGDLSGYNAVSMLTFGGLMSSPYLNPNCRERTS